LAEGSAGCIGGDTIGRRHENRRPSRNWASRIGENANGLAGVGDHGKASQVVLDYYAGPGSAPSCGSKVEAGRHLADP
jgi:hypothetical protein